MAVLTDYLAEEIVWNKGSENPTHPYAAIIDGHHCLIRINDFPDDHLYTLIVDSKEMVSFDDWPKLWKRPEAASVQRDQKKTARR
jgi:hypothetical protein